MLENAIFQSSKLVLVNLGTFVSGSFTSFLEFISSRVDRLSLLMIFTWSASIAVIIVASGRASQCCLYFNYNRILLSPITTLEDMIVLAFALLALFEECISFANVSISLSDEDRRSSNVSMKLVISFKVLFIVTPKKFRIKLANIGA